MKKPNLYQMSKLLRQAHMSRQEASQILDCYFYAGAIFGVILGVALSHFFGFWVWSWLGLGIAFGIIAMAIGAAIIADDVI